MNQHLTDRFQRIDALEDRYTRRIRLALLRDLERALALAAAGAMPELIAASVSTKHLKAVLHELYLTVMVQEARFEYRHLVREQKAATGLPVTDWLRRAKNFIALESSKAIVKIAETTRKEVRQVLKEAAATGKSIADTARSMRSQITEFNTKRARRIARTELIGASSAGSYVGALSTGLALDKYWITTADARTRPTHLAAGGQQVDINQPFLIGGEPCRFPADPALSARERINCRCAIGYKPKGALRTGSLDL
ncbi:hypothetical protein AUC43_15280 [Hymenobacter sedentarius]|uniref:Phage head morphogenesis domain-containing protein n=1 Tax=Hymenobacter sedentarius TaxID=1411621 RepID=A0A0U4ARW1_9BACT|nr:phage minor head protein [Hymenobacter sedentarius]ALW86325.1 hypothetical protein AUC43_15280 [Hymenobacter sedentarius]